MRRARGPNGGNLSISRTPEQIEDRIRAAIIEEIQATNLITQGEPENYIPRFIEALTNKLTELTLDEITFRKR